MKKIFALALAALAIVANAEVKLPTLMGDNMVLQRNTDVKVWGKAAPGSDVTVTPSWSDVPTTVKAGKDGKFVATIATTDAGGPYELKIADKDGTVTLSNVMLGEVWFCAGQSNMEMPMRGFDRQPLDGTNDIIARAKSSQPIRMFISDSKDGRWVRSFNKTPLDTVQGAWFENTPANVANCSATAYLFAKYIQEVLDVPVGVMVSSLGGSRVEPWMRREILTDKPDIDLSILDNDEEIKVQQTTPSILFNAKVNPFLNYVIRGMLWYQGESNSVNSEVYADRLAEMVADYRQLWGEGDFPFYFVEIAPWNYDGNPDGLAGAKVREAQQKASKMIPNSGIISLIDDGHPQFIHPTNKKKVGERLAWLALADTYGMTGFGSRSPMYDSMEVKDGKIYINVKNADRGLCPMWTSLEGFEIAGADQVFHPAFAEIETSTCRLAVSSPDVPEPVAVRYCFKNTPKGTVYNIHGLPLHPFRTDDWNK